MLKNIFLFVLIFSAITYSQTQYRVFVNNINLPINNKGVLGFVNIPDPNPIINGSGGKFDERIFLFNSGFYLSGYINDTLFANCIAENAEIDYQPGKFGSDPEDQLNRIYVVNKIDPVFGDSWQNWKDAVLLGADYYDGNQNGIYDPFDLNYNGTWDLSEDMPPLLGDEIAWCVYNDGTPVNQHWLKSAPVGIEIQQTLFVTKDPDLENVVFIKYKIINTGSVSELLDTVFFSIWDDTDIGNPVNDKGGCDTILQSVYTYKDGADDEYQYGTNPPAVFTTVLQGPVVESTNPADTAVLKYGKILGEKIFSGNKNLGLYSFTGYTKGIPEQGTPLNANQVWYYVHAKEKNGNPLNPCDTLYGKVFGNNCSEVNPMFWFSGDPVTQTGWIDKIAADDRKFSSIGSFRLEKNKPIEILLALVVGRGTDALNSITVARENVQTAINEYRSNFSSMTYSSHPPTNVATDFLLYQNYPNPFNPKTKIKYSQTVETKVNLIVYDILGREIATVINEVKPAGVYEFEFDASSLASGMYLYKLSAGNYIQTKKMILIK